MGAWNNFKTWLTGRNGVYEDEEKVDQAINQLKSITASNGAVAEAKQNLAKAVDKISSCTGFQQYVGILPNNSFDQVYDEGVGVAVNEIITQIEQKQKSIEDYDKSSFGQKVGGTLSMGVGKFGEGFLSVFEGVGDAALTAGAWVTNIPKIWTKKDTAASKGLQDVVKVNFSEKLMSPLTTNDLAKRASAFTADSGAASLVKGAGKAVGYMTLAGYVSGWSNAAKILGSTSKAHVVLASTTNSNAIIAGVSGFGQGTQTGLQSNLGLGASTVQGAAQGAVEGTTAYIAGKIGEQQAINREKADIENLASSGKMTKTEAAKRLADETKAIREGGGYADKLTAAARNKGETDFLDVAIATEGKTGIKKVAAASGQVFKNAGNTIKDTTKGLASTVKGNFTEPSLLASAKNKITQTTTATGTKLGRGMSGIARTALEPEKEIASTLKSTLTSTLQSGGISAASATRLATESALGLASNAISDNTKLKINSDKATTQFNTGQNINKNFNKRIDEIIKDPRTYTSPPTANQTDQTTPQQYQVQQYNYSSGQSGTGYVPPASNATSQFTQSTNNTKENSNSAEDKKPTIIESTPAESTTPTTKNITENAENTLKSTTTSPSTTTKTTEPITTKTTPPETTSRATNKETTTTSATETLTSTTTNASPNQTSPSPTPVSSESTSPQTTTMSQQPTVQTRQTTYQSPSIKETQPTITSIQGSYSTSTTPIETLNQTSPSNSAEDVINTIKDTGTTSLESAIKRNEYNKVPTIATSQTSTTKANSAIPIAAGVSAAVAAGVGAKAYIDRKKNNDTTEEIDNSRETEVQYDELNDLL